MTTVELTKDELDSVLGQIAKDFEYISEDTALISVLKKLHRAGADDSWFIENMAGYKEVIR